MQIGEISAASLLHVICKNRFTITLLTRNDERNRPFKEIAAKTSNSPRFFFFFFPPPKDSTYVYAIFISVVTNSLTKILYLKFHNFSLISRQNFMIFSEVFNTLNFFVFLSWFGTVKYLLREQFNINSNVNYC